MPANLIASLLDRIALRRRLVRLRLLPRPGSRRSVPAIAMDGSLERACDLPRLEALRRDAITQFPDLALFSAREASLCRELIASGERGWAWPRNGNVLEAEDVIAQRPEAYLLGLHPRLLDHAEAYLGEPCYYLACAVKREPVATAQTGTRFWHRDVEDERMVRFILYLCAVDEGRGPFRYLAREDSETLTDRSNYITGYLSDEAVAAVVPRARWNSATGDAGTLTAFDGRRLFHRAGCPVTADRLSVTYTYVSRHPNELRQTARLTRRTRSAIAAALLPRQRACIPPPRLI